MFSENPILPHGYSARIGVDTYFGREAVSRIVRVRRICADRTPAALALHRMSCNIIIPVVAFDLCGSRWPDWSDQR
ncbi:MAG: hypothetical protein I8H77_04715 [Comamonadaceae bacterium]|nr:hypothetical protein [Comamonadaceae bacterium]